MSETTEWLSLMRVRKLFEIIQITEVLHFSLLAMFNSLRARGLQHTRLPYPLPTSGACSNSCPSSWWYHPIISSSIVPLYSCLQSSLVSGSFPMSQFFASGGQSIGGSVSASVLPKNIQNWFPLALTGWIFLQSKDSQDSTIHEHKVFFKAWF